MWKPWRACWRLSLRQDYRIFKIYMIYLVHLENPEILSTTDPNNQTFPSDSARWYAAHTAFDNTVRKLPFSI
jgi:hypothetical protein